MRKDIVVAFFLVVLSVSFPFATTLGATNVVSTRAAAPTIATPQASVDAKELLTPVEYILPYPGLLPTHSLYFLKKFRDFLIELMITDPVKKAEFYILQADKKLNMGIFLFDQANGNMGTKQLADAEVLRQKAVVTLETLHTQGTDIPPFVIEKLLVSLQKQIEVQNIYKRGVEQLQLLVERTQTLLKAVDAIKVINN